MKNKDNVFKIRSKIWIEDSQGNVIFGLGRFRILSTIEKCGSINAAAKELKMGYRAIWGKIKTTEEALGQPLLVRNTGGAAGGGSALTPLAKSLLNRFRLIHGQVNDKADEFFDEKFAPRLYIDDNK
ncbi:MAG: LysR family transcriptional regulator [Proteobacteria bacterium]|nr:LysR family transcriptional regulator [Pseudomonadota bacterium]